MFEGKYLDWNQKRIRGIIDHFGHQFMFQKKILDLGCGHGDIGGALYRLGADVTAIDIRQEHLKITGKKFPGIKTVKSDLDRGWPFIGKTFDIILNLDLMCHLSNYEDHLRAVCASANNIVLETSVCDSNDPHKNIIISENKNIYDLSGNGQGCRPSAAAIERVFKECGFTFIRLDKVKFNSGTYLYNWLSKNDDSHSANHRRIWFAEKNNHLQVTTHSPLPTEAITYPFNMMPNNSGVLQNSNITLPGLVNHHNSKELTLSNTLKDNQKAKIALCISGHLRTFESNFRTVKEHILDKHDCDVFIHTWDTLGVQFRAGDSNLHITDTKKYLNIIQHLYKPKKIIIEPSKQFAITPIMQQRSHEHRDVAGILSMFYKVEECHKLMKEYAIENNIKYDFVVRFRADLWMDSPLPIDGRTTFSHLYLPIYGNFGGACDQIAFASPEVMDKYSTLYSNIEKYLHIGCPMNPEKLLLFHLETQNIPMAKVSIRFVIKRANGLVQDNMLLERAWGMVR